MAEIIRATRGRGVSFIVVLLAALLSAGPAVAQFTTASLGGTVADPSGAVVAGAAVTARNTGTGLTYNANSGTSGEYLFPALPVGTYDLTVTKAGFETYVQNGIELTVNQAATQSVVLKVGAVTERVTVQGRAPLVTTRSATTGQLVNQRAIVDMPLNGRGAQSLVFLIPGANDVTGNYCGVGCEGGAYPGEQYASVNGGGPNGVNYQLDGADNNDTYMNTNLPFPNPDALQEFNVQTGNMSAEFGNAIGGVVNVVTKSGTNQFHGDVFEFLRNYKFDARNFFAPTRDTLKQNQFGGTLGGPIKKDKLFFFGSYQGTRTRTAPNGNIAFVPTTAERAGDFSADCSTYDATGLCTDPNGIQLTDPNTGNPFPYNDLSGSLSPVALNLLKYLPTPPAGTNEINYLGAASNTNDDQFLAKLDYSRSKNQLSGRYFYTKFVEPATPMINNDILTLQYNANRIRVQTVAVNDTFTASPNLLFNTWFGWNQQVGGYLASAPFSANTLGSSIAPSPSPQIYISVGSGGSDFIAQSANVGAYNRGDQTFREVATLVKGRHQITFGGEMLRVVAPISNQYLQGGQFFFDGQLSGDDMADLMLGAVSTFSQGGGIYAHVTGYNWAAFIQDNWRATPRLTLSGGLRWQPLLPYTDSHDRLPCFEPGKVSTRYPNAPAGLLFAGDPGCPKGSYYSSLDNFAPRVGFAYQLTKDGKTSLRGGAGYYYQPPETLAYQDDAGVAPFAPVFNLYSVDFADPFGSAGITNPFPDQFGPKVPPSNVDFTLPATLAYYFPLGFKMPEITIWNLTLERQFGESWLVKAAYFGNKGTHLFPTSDQQPMPDINPGLYVPGNSTEDNVQDRRPYPNFGPIGKMDSGYNSNYNALQLSVEKRMSYGLSFLANYTWSKALNDFSESVNNEAYYQTYPFNRSASYGPDTSNVPNVIKISGIWQVHHFNLSGAADKFLNGWQVAPIITWQSGFPFSVMGGLDNSFSGDYVDRADFVPGVTLAQAKLNPNRSHGALIQEYFNTAAFQANAIGTYGNTGKNILSGPGIFNTDLALLKNTKIGERFTLQFRAEAFNAFNSVNFGQPDDFYSDSAAAGGSGAFGQILSTSTSPRIMQFALKLQF
jgi:Carboxypeptidase regulatory-like domain/TonB dependent receptor-like, beta-barrel/TonB-dependent Receptor Plug Domain